jgi:hypothetical protein
MDAVARRNFNLLSRVLNERVAAWHPGSNPPGLNSSPARSGPSLAGLFSFRPRRYARQMPSLTRYPVTCTAHPLKGKSMAEMTLRNVTPIDATQFAPSTAISVKLQITVEPASGSVLVYSPEKTANPIEFKGPTTTLDVPYSSTIYAQLVKGARRYQVKSLGYKDDI